MMSLHLARVPAVVVAALALAACSSTESANGGLGGGSGSGGRASGGASTVLDGTGGATGTGGSTGDHGRGGLATGTGGRMTGRGGAIASGGATAVGGGQGTGGRTETGGAPGTGGRGTGGIRGTGGMPGTGGATATGGNDCGLTNEVMGWATQNGNTTGGGSATPTVVTSLSALSDAAKGTNAAVIQISGTISGSVSIGSNKTLIGACGGKATIKGHIGMSGSQNVILRNLAIVGNNCSDSPSDCSGGADTITVSSGANHLWFDHCEIADGSDGNLDMTHAADFITVSWTKFRYSGRREHQFCNLIGHDDNNAAEDTGHLNVTFDHVWWADNVAQRMPRVRFGKVHVVNSLYSASGNDSGVGVGVNCNIRVENNVFAGINSAFYFNNSNSASVAESIGNKFTSSSGTSGRGTSFKPPYDYQVESLSTVEASVRAGAGPK